MANDGECSIEGCASRAFCRGWCTKHYSRWQRHGDPMFTSRNSPLPADAEEKHCPRCNKIRSVTCFRERSRISGGGYHGWCRDCEKSYHVERLEDPEKRAARRGASRKYSDSDKRHDLSLQKLYGITAQRYRELLDQQGGCCAICKATAVGGNGKRWHVDHCHKTGAIRGLLCQRCNMGLGYFRDDPALLAQAIKYLGA